MVDMVKVRSASDSSLVLYAPEIRLSKIWTKRGMTHPIDREILIQAYFSTCLESLMRKGLLIVEDKQFLIDVGLITEETEELPTIELTPVLMKRIISLMPLVEVKEILKKLSKDQVVELADYAVKNFAELKMDRIDIISKISGKNILKAIELNKSQEE